MLIVTFFVFSQNGFAYMAQAANCHAGNTFCTPTRSSYLNTTQDIIAMRIKATEMAKIFTQNTEMIQVAATSSDLTHRVAAAFSCGMTKNDGELLYMLASDKDAIVSQASREALIYIARVKYNKPNIDFGPFPNANISQKDDAVKLWRIFFSNATTVGDSNSQKLRDSSGTKCVKYAKPCNVQVKIPEIDSRSALMLETKQANEKNRKLYPVDMSR